MAEERRQRHEEGTNLPVRREERGLMPFDEWGIESPVRMMRRIRDDIERMFSEFGLPMFARGAMLPSEHWEMVSPSVDVWQTDSDVFVRVDIPGVDPDNVEIYTTENSLRISAESRHEEERRERGYVRSERRYGRFERSIELPSEVQADQAKASYKHGVLEIRLPKTEQAKSRMKKVPVEVEEEQPSGMKGGTSERRSSRKK